MAAKRRSGTAWTEQDYAEHGYKTVKLRLPAHVLDAFDSLAAKLGVSRAATLEALLEGVQESREDGVKP